MLELPGVTHRHVEARGMRFHVAEAGDAAAPPVVLHPRLAAALVDLAPRDRRRWRPPTA